MEETKEIIQFYGNHPIEKMYSQTRRKIYDLIDSDSKLKFQYNKPYPLIEKQLMIGLYYIGNKGHNGEYPLTYAKDMFSGESIKEEVYTLIKELEKFINNYKY